MTKDFRQNVFQGRSVLAEKDFTAAELEYLIDFGLHLKALKKAGVPHHYLEGKNHQLVLVQHSPLLRLTLVPTQNTWVQATFN